MEITAKVSSRGKDIYSIEVQGDVYPEDIRKITSCLDSIVALEPRHILFVFRECRWVTAYFIRILLSFYMYIRRRKGTFVCVNRQRKLHSLLTSYGITDIIQSADSETEAFKLIGTAASEAAINSDTKATILQRVQEHLREEEALSAESGIQNREPEESETSAAITDEKSDTKTILRDIHQFEDTVEMEIGEMAVAEQPDPDHSIGHATGIDTDENPVQFLNVNDLNLEKDTDYERKIEEESRRIEKEAGAKGPGQHRMYEEDLFSKLRLQGRRETEDMQTLSGSDYTAEQGVFLRFLDAVPESPLCRGLKKCIGRLQHSKRHNSRITVCIDSEVCSRGLSGWLLKLINAEYVNGVIFSLSAALKDIDGTYGAVSRTRRDEIVNGSFGISDETLQEFTDTAAACTGRPLESMVRTLILQHTGIHKERSLVYRALEHDLQIGVCMIENNPLLAGFSSRERQETAFSKALAFCSGTDGAVVLMPCSTSSMYDFILETVCIGINRQYALDHSVISYFSERAYGEFEQICSGAGIDTICLEGEPGLLVPIFIQALLDSYL